MDTPVRVLNDPHGIAETHWDRSAADPHGGVRGQVQEVQLAGFVTMAEAEIRRPTLGHREKVEAAAHVVEAPRQRMTLINDDVLPLPIKR